MTEPGSPPPVLLVHDDSSVVNQLRSWIEDAGHGVGICSGEMEALEILQRWDRGIVLIDLDLSGLDGLSLCRALRDPGRSWSPGIVVLADGDDPCRIASWIREGADDFVFKPLARREVQARLFAASQRFPSPSRLDDPPAGKELPLRPSDAGLLREVVATLAHDLRTPIGALRTTAETLAWKIEGTSTELAPMIDRMVALSIHLAETVTDVADAFVCDDLETLRESWKRFDSVSETLHAIDLLRTRIPPGVAVVGPPPHTVVELLGSPAGLRRLVMNLLSNALRSSVAGEVRLTVSETIEPGWVELVVLDSGGGIPPEVLPHLGEPLLLSPGSRRLKRSARGAGLGLAICRRIVAQHGGRMLVSSGTATGTRVRIRLRRDLVEPQLEVDYCPLDTEVLA